LLCPPAELTETREIVPTETGGGEVGVGVGVGPLTTTGTGPKSLLPSFDSETPFGASAFAQKS
jgi:hypothetical protein